MATETLNYFIVDVFTTGGLNTGNQLAVVLAPSAGFNERGDEFQAIAKEFGFSETTFVEMKEDRKEEDNVYRVRIYTVGMELPFAGHPTLGSAYVINFMIRDKSCEKIVLDLKVGKIPVLFDQEKKTGVMTQAQPKFGKQFEFPSLLNELGVPSSAIPKWCDCPPQVVSTGIPFLIIPLNCEEDISNLGLSSAISDVIVKGSDDFIGIFFFAPSDKGIFSRMFFQEGPVLEEDPATGSASGCTLSYILNNKILGANDGSWKGISMQGVTMKRASKVELEGKRSEKGEFSILVGGSAQVRAKGEFYV